MGYITPLALPFLVLNLALDAEYNLEGGQSLGYVLKAIYSLRNPILPEDPAFSTGGRLIYQMQITLYWVNLW
jgi:hypothetical protein